MAGTELRYASGVGHGYSSPKYAQKTLNWDFHRWGRKKKKKEKKKEKGGGRGVEKEKRYNIVIFQTDVID